MGQHRADEAPPAPRGPHAALLVHDGITGMRAYLSAGAATLVAIMAAHRTAAGEAVAEPAALRDEIDRISATLTTGPTPRGPR